VGEDEVFKVMTSGKRKKKQWKRMVNKVTYVGESFTRKPPKYERFVRPAALRFKKVRTLCICEALSYSLPSEL